MYENVPTFETACRQRPESSVGVPADGCLVTLMSDKWMSCRVVDIEYAYVFLPLKMNILKGEYRK